MSSLNEATLIGHVGKDVEVKHMQDGRPVANLSLATTETWKDKSTGEKKERTEWHRIVIFNEGLAKVAEAYVKKGSKIFIRGAIQTRKWQDKDGVDRYSTEIVLQQFRGELILLDSKPTSDNPAAAPPKARAAKASSFAADLDDSVPF
jgi:single-strand DNA-binding protein